MAEFKKLKIVIVSAFYSEGMGYSENCLSRALARFGHEVHVISSTFNVYGNEPLYDQTYRDFLGPRHNPAGDKTVDGYQLHRLDAGLFAGYVTMNGLLAKIRELSPDVVHMLEIASLETMAVAANSPLSKYKLFCETHQNVSVIKPYMKQPNGALLKKAAYRLTRTVPTHLASMAVEKCYAVAADCVDVAINYYGVPAEKVKLLLLGTDTEVFFPAESPADVSARRELRQRLGFSDDDIVCLYTGRFTRDKNPLLLAQAVDALSATDPRFKGLFIGDGAQKAEIAACRNTTIAPFMTHKDLAQHYRAADIAVWPRQESMSMLDAASTALPIIVSDKIGDPARVAGNGRVYEENSATSLAVVLRELASPEQRRAYGAAGRKKMVDGFSWTRFAQVVEADYFTALGVDAPSR